MEYGEKVVLGTMMGVVAIAAVCISNAAARIGIEQIKVLEYETDRHIGRSLEKSLVPNSSLSNSMIENAQNLMDKTHAEFNRQCNNYLDRTINPMGPLFRKECSERNFPYTESTIKEHRTAQALLGLKII